MIMMPKRSITYHSDVFIGVFFKVTMLARKQ